MIIAQYTNRSAHLAIQKNDQKLFNTSIFKENRISKELPHINTIRCKIVAFLRLNKSTQKRKNITDDIIMINWSRFVCIFYVTI